MPILNGEQYIKKALNHISKQQYPNLELIISLNISHDNSEKIIKKFIKNKNWIKLFIQKNLLSITEQFAFVVKKSKGKFFLWHAYDDYFSNNFIKNCFHYLTENSNCCVVQSKTQLIELPKNIKKELIKFKDKDYLFNTKEVVNSLLSENKFNYFFYGLFRAEILKKSHMLFNVKSSDRFFLMQFALSNLKFGYINNATYYRGIHKISSTKRYPNDNFRRSIEKNKYLLNPITALNTCKKNFLNQRISQISDSKYIIILSKILFFIFKRQLRLILRFFKYEVFFLLKRK